MIVSDWLYVLYTYQYVLGTYHALVLYHLVLLVLGTILFTPHQQIEILLLAIISYYIDPLIAYNSD
jgi:hypothetical protein